MQKFILKNNKRFQILNVLTDLVDVFRPKIFEPENVRVRTRKKKADLNWTGFPWDGAISMQWQDIAK